MFFDNVLEALADRFGNGALLRQMFPVTAFGPVSVNRVLPKGHLPIPPNLPLPARLWDIILHRTDPIFSSEIESSPDDHSLIENENGVLSNESKATLPHHVELNHNFWCSRQPHSCSVSLHIIVM